MQNPTLIATPFAENGDKNTIPESVPLEPQNATMQTGFPPITQEKISAGGIPPERNDFNGILNALSQHTVFLNKGGRYGFDAEFAEKIGGYEKGACITLDDGTQVVSEIDANTNDPNVNMTGWVFLPVKVKASNVTDESGLTQQEINNTQKHLNNHIGSNTFYVENYGILGDGSDNSEKYLELLDLVNNGDTIVFQPNKIYAGGFTTNKSLNIEGSNSKFTPNLNGDFIAFVSDFIDVSIAGSSIPTGTTQISIIGNHVINKNALIVLWDGSRRDASNPVNFETVRVVSSTQQGAATVVEISPTMGFKKGVLTAKLYQNPINSPSIKNINFENTNNGNYTRSIRFTGCNSPSIKNIETKKTLAHAVSFEECFGYFADQVYCYEPEDTSGGNGYGVVAWKSSNGNIGTVGGEGMRHIIDFSTSHQAMVDYCYDYNPASSVVVLSHNGYCSNIHVNRVYAKIKRSGVYIVSTSSQGYRKLENGVYVVDIEKRRENPTYNLSIGTIKGDIYNSVDDVMRGLSIDSELGESLNVDLIDIKYFGVQNPTNGNSIAVSISGACDLVNIGEIKCNQIGQILNTRTVINDTSRSYCTVGTISATRSNYGIYNTTYNVVVNNFIYNTITRGYNIEIANNPNSTTQANSLVLSNIICKSATPATPVLSSPQLQGGNVNLSGVNLMGSAISVSEGSSITSSDVQVRNNHATLAAPQTTVERPSITISELPPPNFYNGQKLTLTNGSPVQSDRAVINIPQGLTSLTSMSIQSGAVLRLISIQGKWREV